MSQIVSWLGSAEYGVAGNRTIQVNPFEFQPSDISGLKLWLDANNGIAVNANEFGTVLSWANQGDLSGNFDISGNADVRYGDDFVNELNVVQFNANAYMTGLFQLNFQDRSMFLVSKRNTPIDVSGGVGAFAWFTGDTLGQQETGIIYDASNSLFTYVLAKHPVFGVKVGFDTTLDTTGYAELVTFVNSSTDVSANVARLNSIPQSLSYSYLASGYNTSNLPYELGNFFGGTSLGNDYSLCEVILYDSVLSADDIIRVENYLTKKWAIQPPPQPTPPIPAPFTPTDISGLYLWFDSQNISTISADLSGNVASWSNQGLAGSAMSTVMGTVSSQADINGINWITLSAESYMENTMQFPYMTRTAFAVFANLTPLETIDYPYINLMTTPTEGGRQFGVNYASWISSFQTQMCQQGFNCPATGVLPVALSTGDTNLGIWSVDSNTYLSSFCSFNSLSNINNDSNVPNLFNLSSITYNIGSSASNSPSFQVGEYIEYDSYLTTAQVSTVANYLVNKWAISSFTV